MAVWEEMKPYFMVATGVSLLSFPAEVLLPVVRRLRRRTGVSVGPSLVIVANASLALGAFHLRWRRPGSRAALRERRAAPWHLVVPLYLLLSPVLATGWERAVVLRGRSALWGGALSSSGLVQTAVLGVMIVRARRARRTPTDDVRATS